MYCKEEIFAVWKTIDVKRNRNGLNANTRKVKVLSLPETIKQKSTFRAKALRRKGPLLTPNEGPLLETSIFALSFQVVREPLPFAYH